VVSQLTDERRRLQNQGEKGKSIEELAHKQAKTSVRFLGESIK
jgi:hypothetical protein